MSSSVKPKALSGATMGMRFMQRKTPTKNSTTPQEKSAQAPSTSTSVEMHSPAPLHNRQEQDPNVPLQATAADMHGISAEIIGRRSFNNFHKSVEETWVSAVKSRSQSKFDCKVERRQITDEELLHRYEKYVRGNGGMVETKARSIGNLSKKKRKRQKE